MVIDTPQISQHVAMSSRRDVARGVFPGLGDDGVGIHVVAMSPGNNVVGIQDIRADFRSVDVRNAVVKAGGVCMGIQNVASVCVCVFRKFCLEAES